MFDSLVSNEGAWRLSIFLVLFVAMITWEVLLPRRKSIKILDSRRINNLGIMFIYTLLIRFTIPLLPVAAALYATEQSWGLFNLIGLPIVLAVPLAVVLLDLLIYFQHRIFHAVPQFWKLHRMHHTDLEFDVTTGIRFHPIEIILSLLLKIVFVFLLGAPALAVLIFEIILSSASVFNHSNIKIPKKIDKLLRLVLVTPDMHRVHHSIYRQETDSNFGFSVPWWDKIFGTYTAQPKDGHLEMDIGIETFRSEKDSRIDQLLVQPFKN